MKRSKFSEQVAYALRQVAAGIYTSPFTTLSLHHRRVREIGQALEALHAAGLLDAAGGEAHEHQCSVPHGSRHRRQPEIG